MKGKFRPPTYGGPLWTLPILAMCLLVTAYIVDKVIDAPKTVRIASWFVAAAVLHDFILFPAYALLDRCLVALHGKWSSTRPPLINHIRVPAAFAALLLLIWFPTIAGRGDRAFFTASGLRHTDEFVRWLLLTIGFFTLSGFSYLIRLAIPHSTEERS